MLCFRERAGTVVAVAANIAYLISVMLHPYMPVVSARIREQCGLSEIALLPKKPIAFLKCGHKIGEVSNEIFQEFACVWRYAALSF